MLAKACYKNTIPPALKLTHLLIIDCGFNQAAKTPSNKLYVGLRQIIICLCTGTAFQSSKVYTVHVKRKCCCEISFHRRIPSYLKLT